MKKEILAEAKKLKEKENETMSKIFVCPDRMPKQREINRKLVAELKRRREAGENVIIVNSVVKLFRQRGSKGGSSEPESTASGAGMASQ